MSSEATLAVDPSLFSLRTASMLLQAVYAFGADSSKIFAGNNVYERAENWSRTLHTLKENCTIELELKSAEGSASESLSCPELLQAVTDAAWESCQMDWIVRPLLVANRSHKGANDLDPSSLVTSFKDILTSTEARDIEMISEQMLKPLVRSLRQLYGTDDNCGLKEQFVPDRSLVLSTVFPNWVAQAEEYVRKQTGSQMTRGTVEHHANMHTTQGSEALLRSADDLVKSHTGRYWFDVAGTRDNESIERAIRAVIAEAMRRAYEATTDEIRNVDGSSSGNAGQSSASPLRSWDSGWTREKADKFLYDRALQQAKSKHGPHRAVQGDLTGV